MSTSGHLPQASEVFFMQFTGQPLSGNILLSQHSACPQPFGIIKMVEIEVSLIGTQYQQANHLNTL